MILALVIFAASVGALYYVGDYLWSEENRLL